MAATIDERRRIQGTRITIYDVLTYSEAGWHPSSIAGMLGVSTAEVKAALDYISEHREEVMPVYRSILARIARGNPPEVEAKLRESHERFMAKLREFQERRRVASEGQRHEEVGEVRSQSRRGPWLASLES